MTAFKCSNCVDQKPKTAGELHEWINLKFIDCGKYNTAWVETANGKIVFEVWAAGMVKPEGAPLPLEATQLSVEEQCAQIWDMAQAKYDEGARAVYWRAYPVDDVAEELMGANLNWPWNSVGYISIRHNDKHHTKAVPAYTYRRVWMRCAFV